MIVLAGWQPDVLEGPIESYWQLVFLVELIVLTIGRFAVLVEAKVGNFDLPVPFDESAVE